MEEEKLIKAAIEGLNNGFVGTANSKNSYGASVLTKKGHVYSSGAYYSDTYSLTLHAEQAVLAHAASHGEYDIVKIAVIGRDSSAANIVYPCHMCKQLLWESSLTSKQNTQILILDSKGKVIERLNLFDIIKQAWPKKL
jgi:cytidine deaminase